MYFRGKIFNSLCQKPPLLNFIMAIVMLAEQTGLELYTLSSAPL